MTEENTVAIVNFNGMIKRETARIQKLLATADESIPYMNIGIGIKGRIDGDIKINFTVSACEYNSGVVEGNDLNACVEELLRRRGYNKTHAPMLLTKEKRDEIADDFPF